MHPRILALDVGSYKTGYAVIEPGGKIMGRPRYVESGNVESTYDGLREIIRTHQVSNMAWMGPHYWLELIVAIESIEGHIHDAKKSAELLASSHVAGRAEAIAIGLGLRPLTMPAAWWRLQILGSESPSDDAVEAGAHRFIDGIPKVTNVHKRDALCMAAFIARIAWLPAGLDGAHAMLEKYRATMKAQAQARRKVRRAKRAAEKKAVARG